MPRSYSFDHFQVPQSEPRSRSLRRKDKQSFVETHKPAQPAGGVHYGKAHAQTEELIQAKQMAAQLEELARPEFHADEKFSHAIPLKVKPAEQKTAPTHVGRNKAVQSVPIGALPVTEELPRSDLFVELYHEARRQLRAVQDGLTDASRATTRLAMLPLEAVKLAAKRIQRASV